jgi:hypothetical protein
MQGSDPDPNPSLQKWSFLKDFDDKFSHKSGSVCFEKSDPKPVENREYRYQPLWSKQFNSFYIKVNF